MINYGKLAYNRVNDLYRNKQNKIYSFCYKNILNQLSETEHGFLVSIASNEKVYFNLTLQSSANLKVLVNGVTQCVKYNFNSVSFELFLDGNSNLEFIFSNTTFPNVCTLQMFGNFELTKNSKLILVPLNQNFTVINSLNNSFILYSAETPSNVLSNYQENQGEIFNYNYLSCCQTESNIFVLAELNNVNYIIKNKTEIISLSKTFSGKAKIVSNNVMGSSFMVIDVLNGKFSFTLFNSNCEVIESFEGITLKGLTDVIAISEVFNYVDNQIYFMVQDSNLNNYIVLCNISENGFNTSNFVFVMVGKAESVLAQKTSSVNFQFSLKLQDHLKIINAEINFSSKLISPISISKQNNVQGLCYVSDDVSIVNYDGTLATQNGV